MNTNTMERFETLNLDMLAAVEGGNVCAWGVGGGAATGFGTGLLAVAAMTNPVGWVAIAGVGALTLGGGLTGAATFCR
ncbi:TPA: Blp family class II bacteriocin [Streptococcus suis]